MIAPRHAPIGCPWCRWAARCPAAIQVLDGQVVDVLEVDTAPLLEHVREYHPQIPLPDLTERTTP